MIQESFPYSINERRIYPLRVDNLHSSWKFQIVFLTCGPLALRG